MELNPYARYIDGLSLEAVINDVLPGTPGKIARLAETMGEAWLNHVPAPGKWTPAKVIAHLADCELAFGFRLRQTLAQDPKRYPGEDAHRIQPFDQDRWAVSYDPVRAEQGVAAFAALREWDLILIRNASADALGIPVMHPERGEMTFQTIVETMAGHDLNHLQQLEKLSEQ